MEGAISSAEGAVGLENHNNILSKEIKGVERNLHFSCRYAACVGVA